MKDGKTGSKVKAVLLLYVTYALLASGQPKSFIQGQMKYWLSCVGLCFPWLIYICNAYIKQTDSGMNVQVNNGCILAIFSTLCINYMLFSSTHLLPVQFAQLWFPCYHCWNVFCKSNITAEEKNVIF